jgi:hypothetical protein
MFAEECGPGKFWQAAFTTMEFILAIGALAALVWAGAIMLRGGLVGGALLVLLAGSCFGHPFFNLPADPIPLTADRLLLVVLVVQYWLYRRWGWADPKPLTAADYILLALVVVLTASTLTHDFRFHNMQPLSQLVFFYAMPVAMYWVVRQTRWTEQAARWMFGSVAIFGVYLCLTAVAETHQIWAVVFPKYIASSETREFLGRGRGPFLNPAANGLVQGFGFCAALICWPRLGRAGKSLVALSLPVFAWGIYCTFTRSAWMGAGLGAMVIVALTTPPKARAAVLGSVLLAGALLLAVSWQDLLAFKRDKDVTVHEVAESVRLRPILAMVAWHMFLDRPLLGCGFGQYEQESPAYLSDRTTDLPLEKARPYIQHNVFLSMLTQTGLVGVGLFVALLACWTRTAWRLWHRASAPWWVRRMGLLFMAALGVYLPNAMFHDVSIIPMVNMLLFFFGGAIVALTPWLAAESDVGDAKLWRSDDALAVAAR